MLSTIATFLEWLEDRRFSEIPLIHWAAPVPSFGDASTARIATLGLNPSNLEFVDGLGRELTAEKRRFHTLNSLGISTWSKARRVHVENIWDRCRSYFTRNPYDSWFRQLEFLISETGYSFYGTSPTACHLDLIPFATSRKWTELTSEQRRVLLSVSADSLKLLLDESNIDVVILNGKSVVAQFEQIGELRLRRSCMSSWELPRKSGESIAGHSFIGETSVIGGRKLSRSIKVVGYNHNIQSSFGVTRGVRTAIRDWISSEVVSGAA